MGLFNSKPAVSKPKDKDYWAKMFGQIGIDTKLTRIAGFLILLFGIVTLLSNDVYNDGTRVQRKYTDIFAVGVLICLSLYLFLKGFPLMAGILSPTTDSIVGLIFLTGLIIYIYYCLVSVSELPEKFLIILGVCILIIFVLCVILPIGRYRNKHPSTNAHQMDNVNLVILVIVTINSCMLILSSAGPRDSASGYIIKTLPIVVFAGIMIFNGYFLFKLYDNDVVIKVNTSDAATSTRRFSRYLIPQGVSFLCAVALFVAVAASDRYDKSFIAGMGAVLGAIFVGLVLFVGYHVAYGRKRILYRRKEGRRHGKIENGENLGGPRQGDDDLGGPGQGNDDLGGLGLGELVDRRHNRRPLQPIPRRNEEDSPPPPPPPPEDDILVKNPPFIKGQSPPPLESENDVKEAAEAKATEAAAVARIENEMRDIVARVKRNNNKISRKDRDRFELLQTQLKSFSLS